MENNKKINKWPEFNDISVPKIVCFGVGNGSGTKLLQSYIDSHPQIYMIPGYQIMYLYPHWFQWKEEMKKSWCWERIIDQFCIKHASVIDTRNVPAHDGLRTLGENKDQWIHIDESLFKRFLMHLLSDQEIEFKTFLLALHYAYAFVKKEELSKKKVLIYHLHVHEYVPQYMLHDFPDMKVIALIRDPRSNIAGRYNSTVKLDKEKLNTSDSDVYFRRSFLYIWKYLIEGMECLRSINIDQIRVVRHEDMHFRLEGLMKGICQFIEIDYHPCMLKSTFGGLLWWGSRIYTSELMNKPNPSVISGKWKETISPIDWFVIEGLFYDYCLKYNYQPEKIDKLSLINKIILFCSIFIPLSYEIKILKKYLSISEFLSYLKACREEAEGARPLEDYSQNAYYRHKWYNEGLNLWKSKWYTKMLMSTFFKNNDNHHKKNHSLTDATIKIGYIWVNAFRYLLALLIYPLNIFQRYMVSLKQFFRVMFNNNILPEAIS